jgi:hypothetical protein
MQRVAFISIRTGGRGHHVTMFVNCWLIQNWTELKRERKKKQFPCSVSAYVCPKLGFNAIHTC